MYPRGLPFNPFRRSVFVVRRKNDEPVSDRKPQAIRLRRRAPSPRRTRSFKRTPWLFTASMKGISGRRATNWPELCRPSGNLRGSRLTDSESGRVRSPSAERGRSRCPLDGFQVRLHQIAAKLAHRSHLGKEQIHVEGVEPCGGGPITRQRADRGDAWNVIAIGDRAEAIPWSLLAPIEGPCVQDSAPVYAAHCCPSRQR